PDPRVKRGLPDHADHRRHARTGIVGHIKSGTNLHHKIYFPTISTKRHRFNLLSGRVSMMRTVSPFFALFSSSCAYNFFCCFTILPNFGCGTRLTVRTTIVLFIPLEITSPVRVLRVPRSSFFMLSRPAGASRKLVLES